MPSKSSADKVEKRSSIRSKLIAVVLVAIAATTMLVTVASGWREAKRFAEAKQAEIQGTAYVLSAAVADALAVKDRIGVLKALRAIGHIPSFEYARVEDLQGRTIGELGSGVALEQDADLPILLLKTLETRVPVVKEGKRIGTAVVLVNTSELRQRLIDGSVVSLLAAAFSAALGIAIAFRMQDRITRPLRELTATMSRIRETHDFSSLVEQRSNDETGQLVDSFNDMMVQIKHRDERLARHREDLERTVDERTRDLKTAKEVAEEANAAKSDFLATMSHEIRTPMNGMLVMAELLASANLTDRHRRYADVVVKSGQSLLTIINDILDFSKIEAGKLELERISVDPAHIVDDVLNLFWEKATSKGLDLAGYVAPDVPTMIEGDPVRLNQVLSNLVNNALKFTETGHVTIEVTKSAGPDNGGKDELRFAVHDTGIGIAQNKLASVFESFSQADQTTTRRFGGTGLGLAICRRLVEAMDGEIAVSSIEGEGSEFYFTIALEQQDGAETVERGHPSALRNAVVSVCGGATAHSLRRYLKDSGIDAQIAEAEELSTACADGCDIILAEPQLVRNLNLPANRDGATGKPYVVAVSQLGDNLSDELIAAGSAHDRLMRPVSRIALRELVERLDQGKPRGRALLERQESARLPAYPDAAVLVADDSPVNREVVTEALKQLDIRPVTVEDGAEAVRAAAEKRYDLVFMDCSMPEMDGLEATRRIRTAEQEAGLTPVPVVALTAHIAGSKAGDWRDAGMNDYMTKPFRITDLVGALDKFLPEEMRREAPREGVPGNEPPAAAPADRVANGELPVIDRSVLEDVAGCQAGDGSELLERVLKLFEDHAPPALLTLAECAQGGDTEKIGDAAHALKSMCRNIGAARLGAACDRLEGQARAGEIDGLTGQLARLQSELIAALEEIRQIKQPSGETSQAALA